MLAPCDEGRGSIADEDIERRLAPDLIHHPIDGGAIADVASDSRDLAVDLRAHLGGGRLKKAIELAATDHELGAEREEAAARCGPKPRAAAGDQDGLSALNKETGLWAGVKSGMNEQTMTPC